MSFVLCKGCCRHVKRNESQCPFCGADIHTSTAMKTAAVGVVLVGLSMAMACGGTTEESNDGTGGTDQGQAGAYGPPPGDASDELPSYDAAYGPPPGDASDEEGGMAGAYGPPPVDAAYGPPPVDAADDVEEDGPVAAYGPPPMDASADVEEDAPMAAYGPPPPIDAGEDAPDDAMSGAYGPPPDGGF